MCNSCIIKIYNNGISGITKKLGNDLRIQENRNLQHLHGWYALFKTYDFYNKLKIAYYT